MDRIAFVIDGTFYYWSSVILALAALTACLVFLAAYIGSGGSATSAFLVIPAAMGLSLVLARFVHWYSLSDSYPDFFTAITQLSQGGFALLGVFAGCLLAAGMARLLQITQNLPRMLSCMALAGAAGIPVGRLAAFFSSADRGQVIAMQILPFAYPVTNAVSGAVEYRFATFLFQAAAGWILLICLVVSFLRNRTSRRFPEGDTCLLFLLGHGACQVVLDSTRYDSLFFRSNGFVSIVQVFAAIALGGAAIFYSCQAAYRRGFRFWYVPVWLLQALALTGAGFMEYFVQRRGDQALLAYTGMSLCLAVVVGLALVVRSYAYPQAEPLPAGRNRLR